MSIDQFFIDYQRRLHASRLLYGSDAESIYRAGAFICTPTIEAGRMNMKATDIPPPSVSPIPIMKPSLIEIDETIRRTEKSDPFSSISVGGEYVGIYPDMSISVWRRKSFELGQRGPLQRWRIRDHALPCELSEGYLSLFHDHMAALMRWKYHRYTLDEVMSVAMLLAGYTKKEIEAGTSDDRGDKP